VGFSPLVLFVPQAAVSGLYETNDAVPAGKAALVASPRDPNDS
jgi:hypothetical protein